MQSPHTYTSIPVLTVKHTHNWPILEHHTEYLEGGKNHIQKYSISTTNWTFKRSIEDINTFPHINIFFPFYTFITPSTVNIYITSNYHSKWHTAGQNLCTSNIFFFRIVFFEYKKHACKKLSKCSLLTLLTHLHCLPSHVYIQKFVKKTTVEFNDFFVFHAYFKHK